MKAKHTDTVPKKMSEIQADGPVRHEGVFRTSLLERVTREKAPGKSVSDVIFEAEQRAEAGKAVTRAYEMIEECDAEVSTAAIATDSAVRENTFSKEAETEEYPYPMDAEAECADDQVIQEIRFDEVPEVEEEITEAMIDIETETEEKVAEEISYIVAETEAEIEIEAEIEEELAEDIHDVVAEIEANVIRNIIEDIEDKVITGIITEMEADVVRGIVEDIEDKVITGIVAEIEAEMEAEAAITVEQPTVNHHLLEIENDAPTTDAEDICADDAEECMHMLLNGIAVDGGMVATSPVTECVAHSVAAVDDAAAVFFAFISETTPTPSACVRFMWG
jgi:hypothetical protein